jgi:GMP synthase-like glutamine amidotransferase
MRAHVLQHVLIEGIGSMAAWLEIEATPNATDSFHLPSRCTVFHWHGETFDLPSGAVRLARSAVCENQAFQIGRHVMALQFHLETTPASALALIENCRHELVPGPTIQSESELSQASPAAYAEINGLMEIVMSYLLGTD